MAAILSRSQYVNILQSIKFVTHVRFFVSFNSRIKHPYGVLQIGKHQHHKLCSLCRFDISCDLLIWLLLMVATTTTTTRKQQTNVNFHHTKAKSNEFRCIIGSAIFVSTPKFKKHVSLQHMPNYRPENIFLATLHSPRIWSLFCHKTNNNSFCATYLGLYYY